MTPTSSADVIIVGTGVVGIVIAEELLDAGVSVLMLEAGPRVSRAQIVENFRNLPLGLKGSASSSYPPRPWAPHPMPPTGNPDDTYLQLTGPDSYDQTFIRYAGGSTWHWAGTCWRMTPDDLRLHSLYGVGRDWAFDYDTLEPYYVRTEYKLGICGPSDPALQWPPRRSKPYPMGPLPFSPGEQRFTEVVKTLGYTNIPTAQARNSGVPYDERPACCGNNNCVPVCPIGAKYDGATALARLEAKGAVILSDAVAYRVETNARQQVEAVHYFDQNKVSHRVTGKHFVLACNGLENPKLLLMSADDRNPNGVANRSDQVGRNMMDHPQLGLSVSLSEPYWSGVGPVVNSGIMETSQGAFRSEHAGAYFRFNNFARNRFVTFNALKTGLVGKALDQEIRRQTACTADIILAHEMLPHADNRLTLSGKKDWLGLPKPSIHYDVGDYVRKSAEQYSLPIGRKIAAAMGATDVKLTPKFNQSKHIMGGTIMGNDPANSVVDADCRSHDHANLFLPGGGAMPSTACGNSTITMVALAFKAADALVKQAKGA
ncbi:GMC family oxidoreductase [Pigmentiphaga litoralis]|uniref:Choline dehydrogenase-like flavoprotein n=1 Tax=Pigmentiphaga litoralis TaxID=516702 RepID=A0A7Y9LP35_9BURK|nr:GMC family oxidoreductase [Pigmentiphaga litoralis]NYE26337.1 choline dehydrogenase-like flavoprotein [Pigmentiphaga litoralis]NYE85457.1 choline dehydrogenase-like flavoprotein [Pigmentiphaga litoralis]